MDKDLIWKNINAIRAVDELEKTLKKTNVGIGDLKEKREELFSHLGRLVYVVAQNTKEGDRVL